MMVDVKVLKDIYDKVNANADLVNGREPEGKRNFLDTRMSEILHQEQPALSKKLAVEAVQEFLKQNEREFGLV